LSGLKKIIDSDLTYLVKMGNKEAFRVLFERYAPKIYNFALSYLRNEQEAEEMVQDVFLKIWEKREHLDKSKNIKSFIFKIAVNSIYDLIRRKNIEGAFRDFIRDNHEEGLESTWHTVIFEEMLANINELVKEMPAQQQRIFRLSRIDGMPNDIIAEKLNLSKRTVENQLYRALAFLKKHFNRESVYAILFFYLWFS
jgi:RNA polymerase sigma-70 factor (family 1)